MAARNTTDEVKAIWEPPETSAEMDSTIDTLNNLANRFVDGNLLGKECSDGVAITEAQLKDVELFLAAYYLSVRKAPVTSANVLNVSGQRQGSFAFAGMIGNQYGQMAIELDCTGTLRSLVAKAQAAAQGEVDDQQDSQFLLVSDANRDLLT